MTSFIPIFRSNTQSKWTYAGLSTSFPNIGADDSGQLSQHRKCSGKFMPGCKAFRVPKDNHSKAEGTESEEVEIGDDALAIDLTDQVLIFQYKGKFFAMDHSCPHSSYPLSQGTPFDIEDFGIVLSAALTCPKHGWTFDMFTGNSDRGAYKLKTWEIELRDVKRAGSDASQSEGAGLGDSDAKEVWVRRRQRIG